MRMGRAVEQKGDACKEASDKAFALGRESVLCALRFVRIPPLLLVAAI